MRKRSPKTEAVAGIRPPLQPQQEGEPGASATNEEVPGFRRVAHGKQGFIYLDCQGKPLKNRQHLARLAALNIPPAWQAVWICPDANGYLQATGMDAKGRKQYLYHAQWRAQQEQRKYAHLLAVGQSLPRIRAQVQHDLKAPGLCKQKVLAMMVYLLEHTLIRIGNDAYARSNASYGLSTLRHRHVQIRQHDLQFGFRGKSGIDHRIHLHDAWLARWLSRLRDLPGQRLFQYVDRQGQRHAIGSAEVNAYLSQASQQQVTAKDFRTWFGSLYALQLLQSFPPVDHAHQAKRNVAEAIRKTAARLGNTAAVCRRSYIHPVVITQYLAGELDVVTQPQGPDERMPRGRQRNRRQLGRKEGNQEGKIAQPTQSASTTLSAAERTLLKILKNNGKEF